MNKITNKNKNMLRMEKFYGKQIEELLRELYIDEEMTIEQISNELLICNKTTWTWLKEAGIRTRQMKWE